MANASVSPTTAKTPLTPGAVLPSAAALCDDEAVGTLVTEDELDDGVAVEPAMPLMSVMVVSSVRDSTHKHIDKD